MSLSLCLSQFVCLCLFLYLSFSVCLSVFMSVCPSLSPSLSPSLLLSFYISCLYKVILDSKLHLASHPCISYIKTVLLRYTISLCNQKQNNKAIMHPSHIDTYGHDSGLRYLNSPYKTPTKTPMNMIASSDI